MSMEPPLALADWLGPLLGRAHEAHRAITSEALASFGLTPKGFGALTILAGEGPLSQQRLARRQGIDRTTMVAIVDELERAGAVERQRDASDRRAYALQMTRQGQRLVARAAAAAAESEQRFLAPLATEEQRRLKDALRRLLER